MPIDTVFSLLGKAVQIILLIKGRLEQLKLSKDVVTRIKENLEYLQLTIKEIEPCVKKDDSDIEELAQFLTQLENISKSCTDISEKHLVKKVLTMPGVILRLNTLEAEIKVANSKLNIFMAAKNLTMLSESIDFQNKKLNKLSILQENSTAGIYITVDNSVRRPPAPPGFTIRENKNKLILSWKPLRGVIDDYQICYNEQENCIVSVGNVTTVELGPPRVQPGNVYVMKVRGINKGGKGEWSDSMVGQFTKPFPQKPEISNLLLRATIAVVTVKLPEAICSTESPVTCVKISYSTVNSKKLSDLEFKIEPGNHTDNFTVKELYPDTKYIFRVQTRNTEGWSEPSDLRESSTLSLPPIPAKPIPPVIKACRSSTTVKLIAQVPENTCGIKSPIIAWRVSGLSGDKETVDRRFKLSEAMFIEKSTTISISDLNPNQQYTLQLYAKNERGWSKPSEKFTIHVATPFTPKKRSCVQQKITFTY